MPWIAGLAPRAVLLLEILLLGLLVLDKVLVIIFGGAMLWDIILLLVLASLFIILAFVG
jgi:hypothetical protein